MLGVAAGVTSRVNRSAPSVRPFVTKVVDLKRITSIASPWVAVDCLSLALVAVNRPDALRISS